MEARTSNLLAAAIAGRKRAEEECDRLRAALAAGQELNGIAIRGWKQQSEEARYFGALLDQERAELAKARRQVAELQQKALALDIELSAARDSIRRLLAELELERGRQGRPQQMQSVPATDPGDWND